ncbi:MAG: HTTM domain-containing protein [Planctomycetes bacterium]|nr:HTTM domain-containing protein [Planctomycetota bacterium]
MPAFIGRGRRFSSRFRRGLAQPVDGASLALFRIAFGLVMAWHAIKQILPVTGGRTTAQYLYADVDFNFAHTGFSWLRPLPEPWLTLHFLLIAGAGLLVALGLFYRAAAVALFVGYTYKFLLEQADYNNHYYLMCLVQFLLIWMPAAERFSLDVRRRLRKQTQRGGPTAAAGTIPFWPVFLLRAQLFLMYFYGGISKVNADWLTGTPLLSPASRLHGFLSGSLGLPGFVTTEHVCLFMAWGGLLYDLSIGFLLLFARTRPLAIALTAIFHGINHFLFPIGVFPVMAFTATLIFFRPDWPLRLGAWAKRPSFIRPDLRWMAVGALLVPAVGAAFGWGGRRSPADDCERRDPALRPIGRAVPMFVVAWLCVQVLMPLRHYFVAGDANWTEEGQNFSWRMMLHAKGAGHIVFSVGDAALLTRDDRGRSSIDWTRWPNDDLLAVHVPVDSHGFNWRHHPGLTSTFEPIVGYRLVYSLSGTEDVRTVQQALADRWRKTIGRVPDIRCSTSLSECLSRLRARIEIRPTDWSVEKALERLDVLEKLAELHFTAGSEPASPRQLVGLVDELQQLAESPVGDVVREELGQLHPFALQGARDRLSRFLTVTDGPAADCAGLMRQLAKGAPQSPPVVWVDLGRLRPEGWKELPQAFVAFDEGRLAVFWNQFRELNRTQMQRMATRPGMIHQYAQRIAALWQEQTGRRPEVRVRSLVMLNYHQPRYLVDPGVDLAAVDYKAFSHNEWILPHKRLPLPAASVAQRQKGGGTSAIRQATFEQIDKVRR